MSGTHVGWEIAQALRGGMAIAIGEVDNPTARLAEDPDSFVWDGTRERQRQILYVDYETRTGRYPIEDWQVLPGVVFALMMGHDLE